ncbi:hypothetical protein FBU30_010883 [Linnemannia zychae]|nr:hypothetical protein FBU30_010883 [Linnemannia zychae]
MNYIPPPNTNAGATTSTMSLAQVGSGPSSLESTIGNGQSIGSTSAVSSLRPLSATAALSSSFNTLSPGSQATPRPLLNQGARSSYMEPSNPPSSNMSQATQQSRTLPAGGNSVISAISGSNASEDRSSNSSRFARRGPLMSHENSSFGGDTSSSQYSNYSPSGTRSRRESGAWSDTDNGSTPVLNLYRQTFHQPTPQQQQQPFSPATPRADLSNIASPSNNAAFGMQIAKEGWLWRRGNLLTWKRCYAIGRFRGEAHPGLLTLFKDNEHLFPIKTIDMAECLEVQVKSQDTKGAGRFEFKLVTRKEEIWFATDTMSERTGWIDSLNSLMSKAVGASLLKLEAKLNNIRHRNDSLEYSINADKAPSGNPSTTALEEQLQLVQQDLATREQLLSMREQELERKRVESLLVQLEAWRAAAKVTVNQHYAVRDQLLERVMKTARTVQELIERARIHLETGSDQIIEVVNSHLECIRVHANESSLTAASYKMIKSILVGLSVNLDTRSSEIKRVLLVMDQHIHATKTSNPGSSSNSSPASPKLVGVRERRMSVGGPMPPPTTSSSIPPSVLGIGVYLAQVRNKYMETLELLEDHSKRLKRILERADINNPESAHRFQEDVKETLKSLSRHPSYVFTPCLPDQPLPGAVDTFYREDLVVIQQKSKELLKKSHASTSPSPTLNPPSPSQRPQETDQNGSDGEENGKERSMMVKSTATPSSPKDPVTVSPAEPQSTRRTAVSSPSPSAVSSGLDLNGIPKLNLALPASLSSFLISETLPSSMSTTAAMATASTIPSFSSTELTQKIRDSILPEFDHLTNKQEESLQSMTALLNQVSSALVKKLAEIKEATAGQRQEFEELKDEIIDVMQLSATDPSAHQRDISALSEIRSKLADITSQLSKVQTTQQQQQQNIVFGAGAYNGNATGYRRAGGASPGTSAATATGLSLLQRSASTMVHSSTGGVHPYYHTIDSGSRQHLQRVNSTSLQNRIQIPSSISMVASFGGGGGLSTITGGGAINNNSGVNTSSMKQSKIAGMTRLFEDNSATGQQFSAEDNYFISDSEHDSTASVHQNQLVASKLDQLLLLLEFVNTAQCRMMAYQDLELDRHLNGGRSGNVDDGRMMAVQEHMEQMDRKMNLQMHLLRRLASIQDSGLVSLTDDTLAINTASKNKQIDGSDDTEDNSVVVASENDVVQAKEDSLMEDISVFVKAVPPEHELTLFEVLSRLDLQVIPSVKDQSERIHELSDQLSEMKRQLDEQQKRQELFQPQQQQSAPVRSRTIVGSSSNIGRSNSMERPTTPLLHSRSASQTLTQQQQHQQQGSTSSLSSPLETDSPASWRASLRPSQSNGSNSASFRDRILSTSNASPLPTASSMMSLAGSQGSLHEPTASQAPSGNVVGTALVTKTSDRIAELLDKMDSKMGQVIDGQLARYENSNKALLAKMYEILSVETDSSTEGSEAEVTHDPTSDTVYNISKSGAASSTKHQDHTKQLHIENNTLIKQINASLLEDRATIEETKQSLEKILKGQSEFMLMNNTHANPVDRGKNNDMDEQKESDIRTWADSLDRIKTFIQQEGDRSEASMSDQRDEIIDKMNQVLSSIQDSQSQFGSRDNQVREELQELRDWMVRHASQQSESLRELFLSINSPTNIVSTNKKQIIRCDFGDIIKDEEYGDGIVERESNSKLMIRDDDDKEEDYTEIDILEDLDGQHRKLKENGSVHPVAVAFAPASTLTSQGQAIATSTEIQELKEQLEMFTRVQMATFSEMADNVSGVEKMMRDMSKMMGVRRGGTILRRKEAEEGRAMLAMEVKETIQEVIGRMATGLSTEGSGSRRSSIDGSTSAIDTRRLPSMSSTIPPASASAAGAPNRGENGLFKYLYQARRSTSSTSNERGAMPIPASIPPAPAVVAVSPRVDVTTASRSSFSSAPTSPIVGAPIMMSSDNSSTRFDSDHDNGGGLSAMQMQIQLEMHQNQLEQLYKRKARAEMEVEDLQTEKARLFDEKVALREEVKQLRRERQELLMLNHGVSGSSSHSEIVDGQVPPPSGVSSATLLEKMLQDRGMLQTFQEYQLKVYQTLLTMLKTNSAKNHKLTYLD